MEIYRKGTREYFHCTKEHDGSLSVCVGAVGLDAEGHDILLSKSEVEKLKEYLNAYQVEETLEDEELDYEDD